MIDLVATFTNREAERGFDAQVQALLAADAHDEAEARLLGEAARLDHEVARLCLATRGKRVMLKGWADLQAAIHTPMQKGGFCSAVGIDISAHGDEPDQTGPVEPALEVSLYTDSAFPFSTSSRAEILKAATASYATPWQGCFDEIDPCGLGVEGIGALHAAIRAAERDASCRDGAPLAALRIAAWVRMVRFHRAVKDAAAGSGLSRQIPIVTNSHDVPPYAAFNVYMPVLSRESAGTAKARLEAMKAAQRAAFMADEKRRLNERVDSMREMRSFIRTGGFFPSDGHRKVRGLYEAQEAMTGTMNGLGKPSRPSWKISKDAEFEVFAQRFYVDAMLAAREARRAGGV